MLSEPAGAREAFLPANECTTAALRPASAAADVP
jgi:hypothetical protein